MLVTRQELPAYAKAKREEGLTILAIAELAGSSETTVRRALREAERMHITTPPPYLGRADDLMEELRISGNGPITSDWHLPITDFALAEQLVRTSLELRLTDWLVIAGDLFNMDALSDYYPKQKDAALGPEIQAANHLMRQLLKVYGKIYITLGNHDWRLQKSLGFRLRFEHSLKLLLGDLTPEERDRIVVTGRDYLIIDTPEGPWRVCHTATYSKTPLAIPRQLADIHRMHVAAAHRHHHAIGRSASGYQALEMGGLFDEERTDYLKRWSTTFPRWTPGYSFLIDGKPFCPLLTADPWQAFASSVTRPGP